MKIKSRVEPATAKTMITGRCHVESLEWRKMFAAVSWIATTSGDFSNPGNWSNGQVPGLSDDVTINNPAIQVTIDSEQQQINSLTTNASINVYASGLSVGNVNTGGGGVLLQGGATLILDDGGLGFFGTESLDGNGTVQFSDGTITADDQYTDLGSAQNPGATLTVGKGVTIKGGYGFIMPSPYPDHYVSIVIQGNIIADTGETLYLEADASGTIVTGTIAATAGGVSLNTTTNAAGPLFVSGTGTLDLGYGCDSSCLANLTRDGGTVNIAGFADSGPIVLNAVTGSLNLTGTLDGNAVTSADGAQLICTSGAVLQNVALGPGSPIALAAGLATLNVRDALMLTDTTINIDSGSIDFQGASEFAPPDYQSRVPQLVSGSGTIVLGAGSSLNLVKSYDDTADTPISLQISPGVVIEGANASITVLNSSQSFINQGTIACDTPGGTITIIPNGGTFINTGTFEASSSATLAIQGDFAFDGNGTTNIGIGPSGTGTLAISGAATLAGTLNVTVANGFVPPGNQTYDLLTYAAMSGTFAAVNTPTLDAGDVTTLAGASAFTLTTPPPTIAQLTAIVADDRSSLAQSKSQRRATLHDLIVTRNQQQKSLRQAKRTLASLTGQNRRHPSDTLATEIAAQTAQVNSQSQALAQSRQTLSTDTGTDFTAEHPAMKKLLADIHALHQATRRARPGG